MVIVNQRGVARARSGHLWIYRSDIVDASEAAGGAIVSVRDERGRFIGKAFYSNRSEIAIRLLTIDDDVINRDWWGERLRASAERRVSIAETAGAYRLVYSEGDLLPSLIVDRYGDVLVLQTLSQGSESLKDTIVDLLREQFNPRAIIERNDVRVRSLEGLEMRTGVLHGEPVSEIEIDQHGIRFSVAPLGGQKTGAFLDQRENHLAARTYARGRALDCFTFNGGFALNMAKSAISVKAIDVSAEAVSGTIRNAALNHADNVEVIEANVFDALREMEASGERFDTIVLDPPAFAKNRSSIPAAARGYKEINLRALKLLNPGGILITCTCSYHMTESMFLDVVSAASADARRRTQIVERRTQASDHPVLAGVPETLYLKCVIARVLE